uniref:Copper homeostasis protein cutC homolog n=1 Tax=Anopheles dirus TaxID=7168 RepID=A0A182NA70_9DIPT
GAFFHDCDHNKHGNNIRFICFNITTRTNSTTTKSPMMSVPIEVCVDSISSAMSALYGGANRLELCSALSEGGLTPTVGLLREVNQILADRDSEFCADKTIPVYCMIRCRGGGDFCYTDREMRAMLCDLHELLENNADGFVFGALDQCTGMVHRDHCEQVIKQAQGLSVTFHRAIDCTAEQDLEQNLALISELGFRTVLTSGLRPTAEQGIETIRKMKQIATNLQKTTGKTIQVMAGSGVCSRNLATILQRTGCDWVHGSASKLKPLNHINRRLVERGHIVSTAPLRVCDQEVLEDWRHIIDVLDE